MLQCTWSEDEIHKRMADKTTENKGSSTGPSRYFIAKCTNMESLHTCEKSSVWACRDRRFPPQPKDFLTEAFTKGNVHLIFSVNGCRGWHGYAKMLSPPATDNHVTMATNARYDSDDVTTATNQITDKSEQDDDISWHKFKIEWKRIFLSEFGEQACLPLSRTEQLSCLDNKTPVNKARNFQEVSDSTGREMCTAIDSYYEELYRIKQEKLENKLLNMPDPFFQSGEEKDAQVLWEKLIKKVSKLGTVLLACVFGSQRYNLHTPSSDVDMFIVYAADAETVLGFHPPQQTIKNRDRESCDYTIHEVHRYCELLLSGDPRCVETLFLHPSTIMYYSEEWKKLLKYRQLFLNRGCLDKYLRDAQGSKGTKQLEKWKTQENLDTTSQLPKKYCKLFYIVLRLLQNASEVALGENLHVYRPDDSEQKNLLMDTRHGKYTYEELMTLVNSLLTCISEHTPHMSENETAEEDLHKWLMELRYSSLQKSVLKTQS